MGRSLFATTRVAYVILFAAVLVAGAYGHGKTHGEHRRKGDHKKSTDRGPSSHQFENNRVAGGKGKGRQPANGHACATPGPTNSPNTLRPQPRDQQGSTKGMPPLTPQPGVEGVCHFCFVNSSMHLVAPDTNCKGYFSHTFLRPATTVLRICPSGQTFNSKICACSATNDQLCTCSSKGGRPTPTTGPDSTYPSSTASPTSVSNREKCPTCYRAAMPHSPVWSDGCRSFIENVGTQFARKLSCPSNLVFNVDKCMCDLQESARCSCNNTAKPNASESARPSCSHGDSVYRPVPSSYCRNFTHETASTPPRMFVCPSNLTFDVLTCTCNYPRSDRNQCDDATRDRMPQTTSAPKGQCWCSRNGNVYKPSNVCRSFIHAAVGSEPRMHSCPAGLLFNVETCACDRAQNVRCQLCPEPTTVPARATTTTAAAPALCHSCTANGNTYRQLLDSGCRKFTQASPTSAAVVHTCPGNLLFDHNTCTCNHAPAVRCGCFSPPLATAVGESGAWLSSPRQARPSLRDTR